MKLKESPEDFLVDEILDESILSDRDTNYHLYILKKTNYTTERAVKHIANALKISRKSISYAGTKDKNAITTQHIVIRGRGKDKVEELDLQDLELEFKGFAKRKLELGDLSGNRFTITIRDIEKALTDLPESFIVPNYFDEQRFSTNNVAIGMALLKKDFKKAVDLLEGDRDADVISDWLENHSSDFVGALLRMPKKILLFYVHSVQSKLFNEFLKKRIVGNVKELSYSQGSFLFSKELLKDENLLTRNDLLVGFDSDIDISEWGLDTIDFIIKQMPSLTLEGSERPSFFKVKEFNLGKFKDGVQKISFVLGKGSYATIVVKQLFS